MGRGDIAERRRRLAELEAAVGEAASASEYQLKLRDLALLDKARELTEQAAAEGAAAAQR